MEGEAGDAILFRTRFTADPPNRSTEARATFINRYLGCDDYQAFFATDVAMRRDARAAFERGAAEGRLPTKERGIVVRGRRLWQAAAAPWAMNAKVNH